MTESATWGEFRRRMPAEEYRRLYEEQFSSDPEVLEEDEDAREPADDQRFSSDRVPGCCDGDYPPWIAPEQDRYLPDEVLEEFGKRESSVMNGPFWVLPTRLRDAILARLRGLGYEVIEREDLEFY